MYIYMYTLYINCTVNMGLTVSDSLFFQIVSAMAVFNGIYSHLKNISGYRFI